MRPIFFAVIAFVFSAGAALAAPPVQVLNPEVRMVPGQKNGAGYFTFRNNSPQTEVIKGALSDCCAAVEIHSMREVDGVMRMRKVDKITVKPESEVAFEQGGYHLMFIGVKDSVKEGDKIPVRLQLTVRPSMTLLFPVKLIRGKATSSSHEHHH